MFAIQTAKQIQWLGEFTKNIQFYGKIPEINFDIFLNIKREPQ